MIDLTSKPFYLSEEDIKWVYTTYKHMTLEEKIGQLFCPITFLTDETDLSNLVQTKHIGGVLYREGKAEEIQRNHRILQKASKIPLLIAANLESGGTGIVKEGTFFGSHMLVAATNDEEKSYQLGKVACCEGSAVGVNWSFAPVVDIDYNFRNPITNVRTFGSNPDQVLAMGKAYMKGAAEEEVAVAIKHFPGDGIDERDQHLLTSINTMTCEKWDQTFGKVYQGLINEGALTIMAGHIALPAYEEAITGQSIGGIIPATLSKNILEKLLRSQLGFNGLICSDATPMVGFSSALERSKAVPLSIEAGCDMFLFNKNLDEDIIYMREGYEKGILSEKRLEEAIIRILGTKAALKLHKKKALGSLVPDAGALKVLNHRIHDQWARECADLGITLVKDRENFLPLSPKQYRKVLLQVLGDFPSSERVSNEFKALLSKEGFEVTLYEKEDFSKSLDTVENFKRKYDWVLYIGNVETASNKTVSRLNWYTFFGQGNNVPWFVKEVPAVFVSVGNPYHLFDVPMIKTYINCYCNSSYVINGVMNKLLGKSQFKGVSPVDAFCNLMDTRF